MKQFLNYLLNKHWILRIVMCFLDNDKKEKIYIARFRAELAFWGHDTSKMTDEEIKKGIDKMGELISACSFTTEQIANGLKALATINN